MLDFDAQLLEVALKKYREVEGEQLYNQLLDLLDNNIEQAEQLITDFIQKYQSEIISQLQT